MVDVTAFKREKTDFITVEAVQKLNSPTKRRGVILPGAEFRDYEEKHNKQGKLMPAKRRLLLPLEVDFDGTGPRRMMHSMSEDAVQDVARDLGTFETDEWVGTIVQMELAGAGAVPYIKLTVINVPEPSNSTQVKPL